MMRTPTHRAALCGALALIALSFVPLAGAHEGTNHGTIKVHDDAVVDPATRNEPHVSCDFWIEGFNMADDSGHLEFYSIPPTTNPPVLVMTANWTGTPEADEDGFHFNAGPFNLTEGHYRVEAFLDEGRPGNTEHSAKSKVFWVNACQPPGQEDEVPCPPNLTATANPDGSISLDWDAVENASEYRIYRASGGEDLQFLASTTETEFLDTNTTIGVTYTYQVTAVVGGVESQEDCIVEATAIPFFTTAVIGAVALVGGVGAFVMMRRRK